MMEPPADTNAPPMFYVAFENRIEEKETTNFSGGFANYFNVRFHDGDIGVDLATRAAVCLSSAGDVTNLVDKELSFFETAMPYP